MTRWLLFDPVGRILRLILFGLIFGATLCGPLNGFGPGVALADDGDGDGDDGGGGDDGAGPDRGDDGRARGVAPARQRAAPVRAQPPQLRMQPPQVRAPEQVRDRGGRERASAPPPRRDRASPPVARPPAAAPPPPARPAFAPREILVANLSEADLAVLQAEGFALRERIDLTSLAVVLHRLDLPPDLTETQARDRVRARPSGATADFNHFYRSDQAPPTPPPAPPPAPAPDLLPQPIAMTADPPCTHLNCAALGLIGWPATRGPACRVSAPVGVIDTGVNAAHDALSGARIEVIRLTDSALDPSRAVHGTAVAALLVGQNTDRAPGLIPEAPLVVVDIFGRAGDDERAPVSALLQGLDLLAGRGVRVINLSLSGPPNALLEAVLARLTASGGVVVLAAAGNDGPGAPVSYPAGYPGVVAVTAVDRRGQVYRRAQRGPHLDLAAPGVEVWTATSVSGVRPKTGTSFAVPFATAAAAILMARDPAATPAQIADRLRALARDAGAPGPDPVFGAGLLALERLCS